MLRYQTLPVTPFQQNCSIVWCDQTMEAAVIDPGGDLSAIPGVVRSTGAKLRQFLLTHAHIDPAGGTSALARELSLAITGPHPGDQFWIDALHQQAQMFGFPPCEADVPARWLHDGDEVQVGHETLAVRHGPGHTPGHVAIHSAGARRAFVGDVLFAGSVGRTDFPGDDHGTLIASITQRLWPMGDDTVFMPGHGLQSTFGAERRHDPYVGGT